MNQTCDVTVNAVAQDQSSIVAQLSELEDRLFYAVNNLEERLGPVLRAPFSVDPSVGADAETDVEGRVWRMRSIVGRLSDVTQRIAL